MKDMQQVLSVKDADPFSLNGLDLSIRVPEKSEMFSHEEALTYIEGCDYPESVDDLLLAWEIDRHFGPLNDKIILDAMCGPGRLGRELLRIGAGHVVLHDGDETMMTHAQTKAAEARVIGQNIQSVVSPVDELSLPDNAFDLVVCHNSTHQLMSTEKLHTVMKEFLRITKPGGHILIADYQRSNSPEFLEALEERLLWTKPEIVPLLVPTFGAAFSKEEFEAVLKSIQGIAGWSVTDAIPPANVSPEMRERIDADPVKGHLLDFSPISLRVIVKKEEL